MGRLSTHVLDTAAGRPAAGMRIELFSLDAVPPRRLVDTRTNRDGRTDAPLLEGDALAPGLYEIAFHAGAHFAAGGIPTFLEVVPVRFRIGEEGHYHVPLLVGPWSYSTYRGS